MLVLSSITLIIIRILRANPHVVAGVFKLMDRVRQENGENVRRRIRRLMLLWYENVVCMNEHRTKNDRCLRKAYPFYGGK